MTDFTKTYLATPLNYQKIAFNDSASFRLASSATTTYTIPHNLGYVPTAKVWYEPILNINNSSTAVASNQIWPLSGFQYGDIDNTPFTLNVVTIGYAYLDSTNLYIVLTDASASTQNIPVYWRIYYDA